MWLPKDERKLLSFYYRQIKAVEVAQKFEIRDLIKASGRKEQFGQPKAKRKIILDTFNTVQNVNNLLSQRGLITWENINANSISAARLYDHTTSEELFENTKVNLSITLTIKGYDLGRKYSSWWTRSGLWFAEYKNHWIWIIISFLGGVLGALLINWLSK